MQPCTVRPCSSCAPLPQVLARALEVFGLQAVPLRSPDAAAARADPTTQQAFICNLQVRPGAAGLRAAQPSGGW